MKLLLLKDVAGVGKHDQIVDVAEGYAKNFLIAKGFALPADGKTLQTQQQTMTQKAASTAKHLSDIAQLGKTLPKKAFVFKVKTGEKGQVFSGVDEVAIAQAINHKCKTDIKKSQVELKGHLKTLGEHQVVVNLGNSIKVKVKVILESAV